MDWWPKCEVITEVINFATKGARNYRGVVIGDGFVIYGWASFRGRFVHVYIIQAYRSVLFKRAVFGLSAKFLG